MDQEGVWPRPLQLEGAAPDEDLLSLSVLDSPEQEGVVEDAKDTETAVPANTSEQLETAPGWTRAREFLTTSKEAVAQGWNTSREGIKRHKGKIALGAAAVSLTATIAYNPLGEVTENLVEATPWVAGGLAASEGMFVGGLAMMGAAVGTSVRNPLKLRNQLSEICQKANDSLLFKSGFWVNTAGAVGSAAIIAGGILIKMPPESYGLISFSAADLAVTVAVRKAMLNGIKNRAVDKTAETVQD